MYAFTSFNSATDAAFNSVRAVSAFTSACLLSAKAAFNFSLNSLTLTSPSATSFSYCAFDSLKSANLSCKSASLDSEIVRSLIS